MAHTWDGTSDLGYGLIRWRLMLSWSADPDEANAGLTDRQGFLRALRVELPVAVAALEAASTLPFDLTQAAIGPGMAIFSRFARVVEPSGEPMRVDRPRPDQSGSERGA